VKHLPHAAVLARHFPDLPLVIDHLAKPAIKQGRLDDWADLLRSAAHCPNVYCKLSGMITEADWRHWKPSDLAPYVRIALDCFGAQRCMFGSDWPVCELAGTYQQVYQALLESLGPISADDCSQIFGGTAARFYRLPL
jgi:L-fuconolactonase